MSNVYFFLLCARRSVPQTRTTFLPARCLKQFNSLIVDNFADGVVHFPEVTVTLGFLCFCVLTP